MPQERPPTLSAAAARRWAHMAPAQPVQSPWLHEEVARRMESRLQWIVQKPAQWVHWQPVQGGLQVHELLCQRYPDSECFVLQAPDKSAQAAIRSIAKPWWNPQRWRGPRVHASTPPAPVQMVWANMALHMAADPQALIARWHQLLAVDGFLMFSCLGPDTLRELRAIYAAHGWGEPTHQFTDMHDWGDMLVHAGFAEPVMDMERITLSYSSAQTLLAELRTLGRNLHVARFAALRGKAWRDRLHGALTQGLAEPAQGRLQLTFEVIYGHAFKPMPRLPVRAQTTLTLDEMRQTLQRAGGGTGRGG